MLNLQFGEIWQIDTVLIITSKNSSITHKVPSWGQFLPPTPPGEITALPSVTIFFPFLKVHTNGIIHYTIFRAWHLSSSMMFLRFIHVIACIGNIPFYCWAVALCMGEPVWASLVAQTWKNLPATQETQVQSPGLVDFPGEGNGNPLQYSCLENPMDRGSWQATVDGVTKSWTWLSN